MREWRQGAERSAASIVRPNYPVACPVRLAAPRGHRVAAEQWTEQRSFDSPGATSVGDGGDSRVGAGAPHDECLVEPAFDAQLRGAEWAVDEGDTGVGEEVEGVAH